jgi:hypothetical protein
LAVPLQDQHNVHKPGSDHYFRWRHEFAEFGSQIHPNYSQLTAGQSLLAEGGLFWRESLRNDKKRSTLEFRPGKEMGWACGRRKEISI